MCFQYKTLPLQSVIKNIVMMEVDKSPFAIENLDDDPGFLMLQVSRLWEEYHDRALKKYYDISHMQYAVLASVYWLVLHGTEEVTQTVLAKHTKVDPMTVSQIFKVLETKGYIFRQTHSSDVRAKAVFLTQAGRDLMDKAIKTIDVVDNRFFSVLGKNKKYFNQYMVGLLKAND